jgi:hypothetical protein
LVLGGVQTLRWEGRASTAGLQRPAVSAGLWATRVLEMLHDGLARADGWISSRLTWRVGMPAGPVAFVSEAVGLECVTERPEDCEAPGDVPFA